MDVLSGNRSVKAVKGILTGLIGYGIQLLMQIIMVPLILKVAGQEAMGAYSIVMQIIGYGILFDFGFSVSLNRHLAQAFGFEDNGKIFSETFNIGRTFLLFINIILGIIIFSSSFFIKYFISAGESMQYQMQYSLILLSLWIILRTPVALYGVGLSATQNMSTTGIISIICGGVRFFISLTLILLGMSLIGLVLAYIISEALTFIFNRFYFNKYFHNYKSNWRIENKTLFREMLTFGFQYWGVNLAVVLFYGSDSIIVGHLFGAAAASIYYVTKTPSFFSFQFIFKLSDNVGPATNELYAKSEFGGVINAYIKLLKYSLLIALPLALGIICFNKNIISIWAGEKQYAGDLMTICLALFVIIEVLNHINAMIVVVSGKMRWWTTISIIQSLIGVILSIIFGKLIGIEGIMLGFLLSSFPMFIYLFIRVLMTIKIEKSYLWEKVFIPSLLASSPLIFIVFLIKNIILNSPEMNLMFGIPTFLIIWLSSILILGLDKLEKEWFSSIIRNLSWIK